VKRRLTFPLGSFVLLFFFLIQASFVSAMQVSARIQDPSGKPLEGVTVSDGRQAVFTGADGSFGLNTSSDSLIVTRLGYERRTLLTVNLPPIITLVKRPITLGTVRVIERYETPYSTALDKSVIDTDADRHGSSSSDILLRESAFHSSETRLAGENQTLSLLGNLSRHTLFMLDNVPLNPHGEAFDISTLPLSGIKRIEIVKGNASLYGGASAVGGIVYLFTDNVKTAHPLELEQETSFGSFGQFTASLAYGQQSQAFAYRVSVSRQAADNDFSFQPPDWWEESGTLTRRNNRKQQQNIALQLSTNLHNLHLRYRIDSDRIYRQLPGPYNFADIYQNAYLTGLNLRQNLSLGWQKHSFKDNLILWLTRDGTEYTNTRAPNPVYSSHYRQRHHSAGMKNQAEYGFGWLIAGLGMEATHQTYELDNLLYPHLSIPETSRNQTAASFKLLADEGFPLENNTLQAGVRLDKVTDFGTYFSWRVEDVYRYYGLVDLTGGIAYGSGFSLPSFYDLYWKGDSQSLGNPDLEPETSLGGSVWLSAEYAGNSIKAAYYQSRVEKLIQWRQTYLFGTQWKPLNIGKAELTNWEFSFRSQPLSWLGLSSSLTLTDAVDANLNKKLTYTPETKWVTELALSYAGFSFALSQDYTGRQWKTPDNLIDPLPEFFLYGLAAGYGLSWKGLDAGLSFRLNNLFDRQYEIYDYVPQPGRNWLGGIVLKYKM